MADVLTFLKEFPPPEDVKISPKQYDKAAREFVQKISSLDNSSFTKAGGKQNTLDLLDPAVHSISHLFALASQVGRAGKDAAAVQACLDRMVVFCASFDPLQIRYAGSAFRQLLECLLDIVSRADVPDVSPITTALLRLDPSGGTFTSTHLTLLRLCLAKSIPSQALPLLDCDIYAFPQRPAKGVAEEVLCEEQDLSSTFITADSGHSQQLRAEHVLEYYLLGAHVYIGLRNYSRARLFLEYVLLAPSPQHMHSSLQVEVYKKWVLLGLLVDGALFPIPRTHDQQVIKSVRAASKAYESLGDDFERRNWRKFQAEVEVGEQIWHEDGNAGLVAEVAAALPRFRVLDLQKTYAAVPVSQVAEHLSLSSDESLRLLTDMIHNGMLNASITANGGGSADAVLRFHFTTSSAPNADAKLEAQAKRIETLAAYVRDTDRRLQLTKENIEHQRRQKRATAGVEGDPADQMDLTWDAPLPNIDDGDEDLMAV